MPTALLVLEEGLLELAAGRGRQAEKLGNASQAVEELDVKAEAAGWLGLDSR